MPAPRSDRILFGAQGDYMITAFYYGRPGRRVSGVRFLMSPSGQRRHLDLVRLAAADIRQPHFQAGLDGIPLRPPRMASEGDTVHVRQPVARA